MTDDAPKIDTSVPHSARIWNYWLGGRDHYEVDRLAGDRYRAVFPGVVDVARASRDFMLRSVRYLAGEAGIRQFLDVGSGLPAADNTHQVAQRVAPESRIVYADNDPLVLAHARALLTSGPVGVTDYIGGDLREPEALLAAAGRTLDLGRPVGLILSGVLGHIVAHDEARSIVRRLLAGLPPGSHLSMNDGTTAFSKDFAVAQRGYDETGAAPYRLRTPEELAVLFDGCELVEPGLVPCPRWRPEPAGPGSPGSPDGAEGADGAGLDVFGGVGRKP